MKRAQPAKAGAKAKARAKASHHKPRKAAVADFAALLATTQASGLELAPFVFLTDRKMSAAHRIWCDIAPILSERQLIEPLDRMALSLLCVYFAEFVSANDVVNRKGYTQSVKTVAGGNMERLNPAVAVRDRARDAFLDLAGRFGLTPTDRARLMKLQKGLDIEPGDLFAPKSAAPTDETVPVDPHAQAWGALLDAPADVAAKPN